MADDPRIKEKAFHLNGIIKWTSGFVNPGKSGGEIVCFLRLDFSPPKN